jgi:hypothetical protein
MLKEFFNHAPKGFAALAAFEGLFYLINPSQAPRRRERR